MPRFIELITARAAAESGTPAEGVRRLPDYEPYGTVADRGRRTPLLELDDLSLEKERRVTFYPLGAAMALVLDQVRPGWKAAYFDRSFELTSLFPVEP